jgi:transcriptional regulator with XRE-family HTH domain
VELATKLKARLDELGLSQADLVDRTGLSSAYISELLNGKRGKRLARTTSIKLRRALHVPDSFFDCDISHMQNRIGETSDQVKEGV